MPLIPLRHPVADPDSTMLGIVVEAQGRAPYATAKLLQGRNYFFFFEPGTPLGAGLALVCGSALLGPRGSVFFSPAMSP